METERKRNEEIEGILSSLIETTERLENVQNEIMEDNLNPIIEKMKTITDRIQVLSDSTGQNKAVIVELLDDFQQFRADFDSCSSRCGGIPNEETAEEVKKLFDDVDELIDDGKTDQALALAYEHRVKLKDSWDYWIKLGSRYSGANENEKAKKAFEQAIKLKPEEFLSHCQYSGLIKVTEGPEKALSYIKEFVKSVPLRGCHVFYNALGWLLMDVAEPNDVEDIVSNITNPDSPECTPCVQAFLYSRVNMDSKAISIISDHDVSDCAIYPLVKTAIHAKAEVKEGLEDMVKSANVSKDPDPFEVSLLIMILQNVGRSLDCDPTLKFVKRVKKRFKSEKIPEDRQGALHEYSAYALMGAGCKNFEFISKLQDIALETHECSSLRYDRIILKLMSKQYNKAAEEAREALDKYDDDDWILLASIDAISRSEEPTDLSNLYKKALDMKEITTSKYRLMVLKNSAIRMDSPFLSDIETLLKKIGASDEDASGSSETK